MPDDDDRPRDGGGSAGPSGERAAAEPWSDFVIPDDIRGLWRDVSAYRREVRRHERARRLHRLLARRGVVPVLAVTTAVLIASLVAAMLTLMNPRPAPAPPAARPIAADPVAAPGRVGGLLPHATVYAQDGSTAIDTHSPALRPQVFALVPPHCDCEQLLNALSGQAGGENMRLAIVVPTAADDSAGTIIDGLDRGLPSVYFDPQASLASGVTASGVTAVVVDEDGTIYSIVRDITGAKTTLVAQLQSMLLADRH